MAIDDSNKHKLKSRLARTLGQLQGVLRMVEDERYCIDVLHQIKAVQASLDKTAEEILKAHLESCVVEAIRQQDEKRVMDELLEIFRKSPRLYDAIETTSALDVSIPVTSQPVKEKSCCGS